MSMHLLLTDNTLLLHRFIQLLEELHIPLNTFHFAFSPANKEMQEKYAGSTWIKPLSVKNSVDNLIQDYILIISLHSKQIFPAALVQKVRCVNVHPGLNPHNRGWFPQVFSILNQLPCGATIHEMDEQLDHGPIIAQQPVDIESWDTSFTAYHKILDAEIQLLRHNLRNILNNEYNTFKPDEGNVNLKKDFDALCEIKLDATGTWREHLNHLRALTHGNYQNAYFMDDAGNKVMVSVTLNKV
ncbi:MAG TPA: dTDP-4-amino-4,6-dideoxyglucose formyltransferase [Ferruginibacter sp.]|nr:dTDP-4-amino-4,6-dideoxyglucose formyltransferase [Ferruginibacter sp.]HRO16754.1 dTDP-4-amino-4,6-dideoxyglucose formyltransferase [Ferruginibacter sp.]HRQ19806.1 dTDP-4-amino-4,6-dideoxyglucose formyltransferase [Ferruginibacter sp.]